jgi:HK97 family phage prohead protease
MADKKEIPMEHKQIEFKFTMAEGDAEPGSFTGYGSVFDAVDSYGDAVRKGAFKKTLREKKKFPLLWSHDSMLVPIGIITGEEDDHGLKVAGSLNLDIQLARDVRSAMKQESINGLSIGYNVVKKDIDNETGIRTLKEINLWEISACVFQACPGAVVAEIKSRLSGEEPDDKSTPVVKPEYIHLIDDSIARIKSYLNS